MGLIVEFTVPNDAAGMRIDVFLGNHPELHEGEVYLSRSRVQHLIEVGAIEVDGEFPDKSDKLKGGERIRVEMPDPESGVDIPPQDLPIDVIYEDDYIVVVSKPAAMTTHPTSDVRTGTLVNALKGLNIHLPELYYPYRPGIVHRLDKRTSGLLVVAKKERSYLKLVEMIKDRKVKRFYRAVTLGNLPARSGRFEEDIGRHPVNRKKMAVVEKGGKSAVTIYRVLQRYPGFDHAGAQLLTGRTHQIRVHFANAGAPVFGDDVYGRRIMKPAVFEALERMGATPLERSRWVTAIDELTKIKKAAYGHMLHAYRLCFEHPITGESLEFESQPPGYFIDVLNLLAKMGEVSVEP